MKKNGKLSVEEFVKRAIENGRGEYAGLHTVYSGFNDAFRKYYDGADPIAAVRQLVKEGKISSRPAKGGFLLYISGSDPTAKRADDMLNQILKA